MEKARLGGKQGNELGVGSVGGGEIREHGAYSKESIMISQSSGVKERAGKEEERL